MFDFKQANEWLQASNLGRWEVYPRAEGKKAADELQKVASKQNRGKRHFEIQNAANIRNKYDTYVFSGADGRPAVYVLGFWNSDRVGVDDIWGCETSGAVEPRFLNAVKALTQSDNDFKLKLEESAKVKVATTESLTTEEKVYVKTFLPPNEGYEVQAGLIGGATGFMSSMSRTRNSFVTNIGREETQQAQQAQNRRQGQPQQGQDEQDPNQRRQQQNPNDPNSPPEDPNNPNNSPKNNQAIQDAERYAQVFQQLALISIIKENLPMNSEQIRLVLESIESGAAVQNDNGELLSVTFEMTSVSFDQIEEFLNHPENAKYGIVRGEKYIKLRDKIMSQQEEQEKEKPKNKKQKNETAQETESVQEGEPVHQEYAETHENDFKSFGKELDSQLEQGDLPEPQSNPKETPKYKLKKFQKPNKRFIIKNHEIRTKQH